MKIVRLCAALAAATLMVVACGTDDTGVGSGTDGGIPPQGEAGTDAGTNIDGSTPPPVASFSIGGTVSGLLGTGLVLQNNAGDDLPVAADGSFTFPKKLAKGAAFSVSIKTQPTAPSQTCVVSAATGAVASGNVTTVVVNCAADKFTVGGTVTGLAGAGLVLQNNGAGDLIVNANGTFAFPATVASGKPYAVTVKTQPGTPTQTCTVTAGTGTVAAANITNVAIACTTDKFTVGGNVTGLTGAGLILQVNGGDSLPVAASGAFTFATPIESGANYTVTVSAQPTTPSQTCTVSGGTGTVGAGNVTSVTVNCATNKYTIGGTASGLLGTAVLQNNGGNDLTVNANGTFAFSTPIDSGAAYAVTIKTQPGAPSQTCFLTNPNGNVAAANVTNVVLTCVTNTFKVKGNVTGLAGAGLILQNNAGDDLAIAADGAFEFVTSVASGQTYAVTVNTQPTSLSQTCTVTNANGTIGAADVTNVAVTCVTNSYTVGGSAAGLSGSGLVLQNNLGDDLAVAANGAFTFATGVLSGGAYSVTVKTQPANPSQTCTVAAGSGTVTNGNVVTAMVNCTTNSYAVGGSTSGLAGTGLVLQNNGGDNLTINGNGGFAFATPIASGAAYAVTVLTQPTNPSQTCTVTSGAGNVGGAAVTTVAVACTTNTYTVGGNVTGMAGGTLVLQNNAGDNLNVTADGAFTFTTPIASGATYAVTVLTNPAGRYCSVASGGGTVGAANVTTVSVTCITTPYATGQLASGTRKLLFAFAPAGTSLPTQASYDAYCTSKGFSENKVKDVSRAPNWAVDAVNYYCDRYCCFLGAGNSQWSQLSGFQNFGLPLGTALRVFDRGCGNFCGSYNNSLNTTDTLNISGPTTATYAPNGSNYCTAKSDTFDMDGVVVCQEP